MQRLGDDSGKVTPLPIPNREVKLISAEGSAGFLRVRIGRRRDVVYNLT